MRVKEGAGKGADAPLAFRPGHVYNVKIIDIVFLVLESMDIEFKEI